MDFADPGGNLAQFGLGEGKYVADLGAGSGHYSIAAAKAVGSTGRVYAIEVQKELLERVKNLATQEGIGNIEVLWGDVETEGGTKLRNESVDVVILSNILFQLEDKAGCANEAKRILKTKGRVLIVDWQDSYGGLGPSAEVIVNAADARNLFENQGFVFESEISAGGHHYGFSMIKI